MQVVNENNIEKRILFYLSKMYTQTIGKGEDYKNANKCISILFTDFEINNLKTIPKYITKWNLREENYTNIILTDVMEIYIIQLSKVNNYSENSMLDTWVKFINNSGDVDMSKADESVKKAKKVLEQISEDEHERYLADMRIRCLMQKQGIEEAGFERGFEDGFEDGFEQGSKQSQIEIARKLKKQKVDINIILESTGLTKEEIEKL